MAAARVTLVGLAHSVSYLFVPTTALGMESVMTPWRPAIVHKGSLVSGPVPAYYIIICTYYRLSGVVHDVHVCAPAQIVITFFFFFTITLTIAL